MCKIGNLRIAIEPLEVRRMLAGVTILVHRDGGNIQGCITAAADAIAKRIPASSSIAVMSDPCVLLSGTFVARSTRVVGRVASRHSGTPIARHKQTVSM